MAGNLLKFGTKMVRNENDNPQQKLAEALAQYRELLRKGEQATPEEKEALFANFNEQILQDADQRYDTLSDDQKKQYGTLASIWNYNTGDSNAQIQDKDDKLVLRCQNQDSGLQLAIMSDSVSLVLAQENQIPKEQLVALHDLMDNAGLEVTQLPENATVKAQDGSTQSINDAWREASQNEAANEVVGASNEFDLPSDFNNLTYEELEALLLDANAAITQGGGNKNQGLYAMRNKIKAKMGSMGYSGNIQIGNIWNGYKLTATKEDSKGKNKKVFDVKVKMEKGVPSATYRMWNGEKFDSKIAVMCLDALKTGGADYFTMPSAVEIGGSEYVAFMEGAGKTLMVPICKSAQYPDAIELDADAVKKMLEAAEKNNTDSGKMSEFKERLLGILQEQEAYKASKNANYTTNSVLQTEITKLQGASVERFNREYLSTMTKEITKKANDYDKTKRADAPDQKGYDFITTQAAFRAAADISDSIREATKTGQFSYSSSDTLKKMLDRMFQHRLEEHKMAITNDLNNPEIAIRRKDKDPLKEIREDTQRIIEKTSDAMEDDFPGIKLSLRKSHTYTQMKVNSEDLTRNGNGTYIYANSPTTIPYDVNPQQDSRRWAPLPNRSSNSSGRAMPIPNRDFSR